MHSVPFKRSAFSLALSSLFFAGLAQAQQVEEEDPFADFIDDDEPDEPAPEERPAKRSRKA